MTTVQITRTMSEEEIDLVNRDPNNLNDSMKVMFEDVFGEPDGTHSIDCVWSNSFKCFTCAKSCCYKFLGILCAIPIALCWGCEFAMISFQMIWYVAPCLRVWAICLSCFQRFISSCFQCCVSPMCESCGMFFSKIRVVNSSD